MAEIAAVPKDSIQAWPQRSSRLRDWADHNLVIVDGEPTPQQLAAAQKATRRQAGIQVMGPASTGLARRCARSHT